MEKMKVPSRASRRTPKTKDPTEVEDYLKLHISQFNVQKNRILDKINALYDMNEATFALRQQLNKRNEELVEIKATVSNLQFTLIQQQDQNLSLLKENDELRLRLLDYQKKVQILLSYANIPKDFPILSLVRGAKADFVVERKKNSKVNEKEYQKTTTKNSTNGNVCECTIHKSVAHCHSSAVCTTCGKLVKKSKYSNSETDDISSPENGKSYQHSRSRTSMYSSITQRKHHSKHSSCVSNVSKIENSSDLIDDIDQANLVIQSLRAQLHEIKYNYDQHIDLLQQDTKLQQQEHKAHIDNFTEECQYYNTYVKNLHLVLYQFLYEDACTQHMGTSYLPDLYTYMICVQKCKQLLGDKFPHCVKSYLTSSPAIDNQSKVDLHQSKLEHLKKRLKHTEETNTHLNLALSSAKVKQQENLITMNERVELYRRKQEELLERKNQDSKYYRKQIDNLVSELNKMLGER